MGEGVPKIASDAAPASKRLLITDHTAITSQLLSISELRSSSDIVKEETVKSIRASRLADAMQQPTFSLLSRQEQQAIREEWLALLC